jgi:hypothetical protein
VQFFLLIVRDSSEKNNMETIERQELINYVQEELICTIGSADAPVTIPVLITTFRFFFNYPKNIRHQYQH